MNRIKVRPSGIVAGGLCGVKGPSCTAATKPSGITYVFLPDGAQVAVCGACLDERVASGAWRVEGARSKAARTGNMSS